MTRAVESASLDTNVLLTATDRGRPHPLPEDERVTDRLCALLGQAACTGKQIHDANDVATMLVHGVATLVRANPADFRRFDSLIAVLDLAAVPTD